MPEAQAGYRRHILDRIVETKRGEVRSLVARAGELAGRAADAAPVVSFLDAIPSESVGVIAEVKRRSPGAGLIRPDLDPIELAASYEAHGAMAISVLTDREYFGGGLDDLVAVRSRTTVPLLRKDFMIDPLQITEARGAGADLILLIVRILTDQQLVELREVAEGLGMTALVEVHDAEELERARASGASVIGINNRDLSTFHTDLAVTEALLGSLPPDAVVISESGIRTGMDVARVGAAGVEGVLVGESILRSPDPAIKLRELCGHERLRRGE